MPTPSPAPVALPERALPSEKASSQPPSVPFSSVARALENAAGQRAEAEQGASEGEASSANLATSAACFLEWLDTVAWAFALLSLSTNHPQTRPTQLLRLVFLLLPRLLFTRGTFRGVQGKAKTLQRIKGFHTGHWEALLGRARALQPVRPNLAGRLILCAADTFLSAPFPGHKGPGSCFYGGQLLTCKQLAKIAMLRPDRHARQGDGKGGHRGVR